jgi:hypothetical protein
MLDQLDRVLTAIEPAAQQAAEDADWLVCYSIVNYFIHFFFIFHWLMREESQCRYSHWTSCRNIARLQDVVALLTIIAP